MQTGAEFDATGRYRYMLWRSWDEQAARVGFVMLNPSRADAVVNDPTIRRCLGFAQAWGLCWGPSHGAGRCERWLSVAMGLAGRLLAALRVRL